VSTPTEDPPASPGGPRRGSLRAELLYTLAFLAFAAILLALAAGYVLWSAGAATPLALGTIVALDLGVFVLLGRHLLERWVLRPLSAAVDAAQAIAAGDYARRVPPGEGRETAALAAAINRMTDQLLVNQEVLAENVRSLDETNQRLLATQGDLVQAEKLASVGRLAAGVAHEIGNPLGALLGYTSVLRRRGGDPELTEGLEREARRIDRIVRRLLDYSRPAPMRRHPVDVNDCVRRVAGMLADQGALEGVELVLRLGEGVPPVRGDAHLLDQVFVNLVANARAVLGAEGRITVSTAVERYEPERPIPVRRAEDPPGVSYAHLRRPRYASVRDPHGIEPGTEVVRAIVADTGPGIAPEHIEHVFDPFFTTRPPGEGTGLGLAIVASTVADFGGRIEASSAAGGGAVFTLLLPTFRTDS
jgi:signal transduction histidine kinase